MSPVSSSQKPTPSSTVRDVTRRIPLMPLENPRLRVTVAGPLRPDRRLRRHFGGSLLCLALLLTLMFRWRPAPAPPSPPLQTADAVAVQVPALPPAPRLPAVPSVAPARPVPLLITSVSRRAPESESYVLSAPRLGPTYEVAPAVPMPPDSETTRLNY